MLSRPQRHINVLSISALDLFASALGVFILIAILMFPYYLRQPALESAVGGAEADLSAQAAAKEDALRALAAARAAGAAAEARRAQAAQRIEELKAAAAAASEDLSTAQVALADQVGRMGGLQEEMARLAILDLDLVFVMDTTGSMRAELQDIQVNLLGIVRVLHRLAPTLRVGFVAFKDRGDAFITRAFPLTDMSAGNLQRILGFVQSLKASGGGDKPEPIDRALEEAIAMTWRENALGRIIVIGDAPVHSRNLTRTLQLARDFRKAPAGALPRSVATIFTGEAQHARQFFLKLSEAGGGDFGDHRGIMIESVLLSVLA